MDRIAQPLAGQPIIIGAAISGLMTAVHLSPEPAVVLTKAPLASAAASGWAQGGIAAALGQNDNPTLHASDTIAYDDGQCDPRAVERITYAARAAVEELVHGAVFDRATDGPFKFGLVAHHSRRRIVHTRGDGIGREILSALTEAVRRTPSITVLEGVKAHRLLVDDGKLTGVLALAGSEPLLPQASDTGPVRENMSRRVGVVRDRLACVLQLKLAVGCFQHRCCCGCSRSWSHDCNRGIAARGEPRWSFLHGFPPSAWGPTLEPAPRARMLSRSLRQQLPLRLRSESERCPSHR